MVAFNMQVRGLQSALHKNKKENIIQVERQILTPPLLANRDMGSIFGLCKGCSGLMAAVVM